MTVTFDANSIGPSDQQWNADEVDAFPEGVTSDSPTIAPVTEVDTTQPTLETFPDGIQWLGEV